MVAPHLPSQSSPSPFSQLLPSVTPVLLSTLPNTETVQLSPSQASSVLPSLSGSRSLRPPLRHSHHQTLLPRTLAPGREILPPQPLDLPFRLPPARAGFWKASWCREAAAPPSSSPLPPAHTRVLVPQRAPPATNVSAVGLRTRPPCSHPRERALSCPAALHSGASK